MNKKITLARFVIALAACGLTCSPGLAGGNVTAELDDKGKLKITGDDDDNEIRIVCTGPAEVTIESLVPPKEERFELFNDSTTTINGQSKPVVISEVTGKIEIKMKKGLDSVVIRCLAFATENDLKVDLGKEENDNCSLSGIVGGKLNFKGHRFELFESYVAERLKVRAADVSIDLTTVLDDVDIKLNDFPEAPENLPEDFVCFPEGKDLPDPLGLPFYLVMNECIIGEDLKVEKKMNGGIIVISGIDVGEDFEFKGSNDKFDRVSILGASIGGELEIKSRRGRDFFLLADVMVAEKSKIEMGDDDDCLRLVRTIFEEELKLRGGKDNDGFGGIGIGANVFNGGTDIEDFETVF